MLRYDFEESIGFWLIRGSRAYEQQINAELADRGITLRQWQVLGLIAFEGPVSQAELAEMMHIEPPTLVGILDRMERDGWIERNDCPGDRRRKLINAAPAGEKAWDEIAAAGRRVRARATVGISAEEIELFKDICRRLLKNMKDRPLPSRDGKR